MKIAVAVLCSWLIALIGYSAVVARIWPHTNEMRPVVFWATIMLIVTVPTLYVPLMFALAERVDARRPVSWLVFPAVGIVLSLIPTLLVVANLSTHFLQSLMSLSTLFLFGFCATFGSIFGVAVILIQARSNEPLQPSSGANGSS